uniref:Uncharacterized protein n=1 Tax=Ditylenchus dipsaci TaxID=166011 RepID=A0A915DNN9_9BILA
MNHLQHLADQPFSSTIVWLSNLSNWLFNSSSANSFNKFGWVGAAMGAGIVAPLKVWKPSALFPLCPLLVGTETDWSFHLSACCSDYGS